MEHGGASGFGGIDPVDRLFRPQTSPDSRPEARTTQTEGPDFHSILDAGQRSPCGLQQQRREIEQSTVMTRSFTSMLLGLQYLAAIVSGNNAFRRALIELAPQVEPLLKDIPQQLRLFAESRSFSDFVFLAQGPLFSIASECMLKVTESSCSYAQVFHSLEFRHGPKSIVGPETLITFLMSETSYDAELELLEEMSALGAATMVIANRVESRAQRASDFAIELGLQSPEYVQPAAFTIWGQLYGVYYGLKKGFNPDSPKNLTRVGRARGRPQPAVSM